MKKKTLIPLIAVTLVLGLFYLAFARGHSFGPGPGIWKDLSKEQIDKLSQIREKFRAETQTLRNEIYQKRLELQKLYADPNANEEQIREKQRELNSLRERLEEKNAERRLEERKVFTPDQLTKLGEFQNRAYGSGRFCRCR